MQQQSVLHASNSCSAQSSAPPSAHDYLLLDQLIAAELHVRYMRRVVPVYIGPSKADGAPVHPAQRPPQVTNAPR
jgi:hypothetical protein